MQNAEYFLRIDLGTFGICSRERVGDHAALRGKDEARSGNFPITEPHTYP